MLKNPYHDIYYMYMYNVYTCTAIFLEIFNFAWRIKIRPDPGSLGNR